MEDDTENILANFAIHASRTLISWIVSTAGRFGPHEQADGCGTECPDWLY